MDQSAKLQPGDSSYSGLAAAGGRERAPRRRSASSLLSLSFIRFLTLSVTFGLPLWARRPSEFAVALPNGSPQATQSSQPTANPPDRNSKRVVFTEISHRLHIKLSPIANPPDLAALGQQIKSSDYSLDYARRKLVPAMGGSIAVGDYDGDGNPDLYIVVPGGTNHLLHNNGRGKFSDVTKKARVSGPEDSLSAVFADYDHSGRQSLFVVGLGGVTLYRNNGDGTFSNDTQKAGLIGIPTELDTAALLFGSGNNSVPDLLVTAYTDLGKTPAKSSFVFPKDFQGTSSHLYHNNGDGTFREITMTAGLASNPGRARCAVSADFNGDGQPDLLLLRDNKPPVLYLNQGGDKFRDATGQAGEDIWDYAFVSANVADFNHDGMPDLALWSTVKYKVLLNQGSALFDDIEHVPGIRQPAAPFVFHGTVIGPNGGSTEELLVADVGFKWHIIANDAGKLKEMPAVFSAENFQRGRKRLTDSGNLLEPVSMVVALRLGKRERLVFLALTADGQVAAFEEQESSKVRQ
ncbi:MAG TPA: VCBS repeat-containing protein [Terriglobia bacterium]|nr:VCBS repeat-containing protein [Terriglobia bacterium]